MNTNMANMTGSPDDGDPSKLAERISRKDQLALTLSLVALLVSASTLALNRWDQYKSKIEQETKASYAVFQLGKRFGTAFLVYVYTREGDPMKVDAAKEEALSFARQAQAYAETLDLRMNLAELVSTYRYKNQIIHDAPFSAIETRLEANYGRDLSGKFAVAYWLTWMRFNAQAAIKAHPEYVPQFKKDYPKVAQLINTYLAAMGLSERVSEQLPDLDTGKRETRMALNAVDAKLDTKGR